MKHGQMSFGEKSAHAQPRARGPGRARRPRLRARGVRWDVGGPVGFGGGGGRARGAAKPELGRLPARTRAKRRLTARAREPTLAQLSRSSADASSAISQGRDRRGRRGARTRAAMYCPTAPRAASPSGRRRAAPTRARRVCAMPSGRGSPHRRSGRGQLLRRASAHERLLRHERLRTRRNPVRWGRGRRCNDDCNGSVSEERDARHYPSQGLRAHRTPPV